MGFMSQSVGQSIEKHIGKFLEYDVKNNSSYWMSYMRLHVLLDVKKSLMKPSKIRKP